MKNFEIREIGNDENFDPSIICDDVPFTQAGFYGDWQKTLGRTVKRFLISNEKETIAYFQLVKYPLLRGKSYLYAPYGPVTKDHSEDFIVYLKKELERIAKEEDAVFFRLDFTPPISNSILSKFFKKAPLYTYHSAYFQPRVEWFLGLNKTEEELIAEMNDKNRYSLRAGEKRGATAEIITEDFGKYFETFYELMEETAKRNKFSLHTKEYYKNIFQDLHKTNSYLSVAKYGEKILVIDVIIVFGKVANYVFGCSSSEERTRMPSYLSIWKAICHAKKIGCDYYNFGGIASESKAYKGWDGLTTFKKRFGGKEVVHCDFFDIVISPFWYHLYNLRKIIRKII